MTDPFNDPAFEKKVYEEFYRIGIQGGINFGGCTPEQFLEVLRRTPDGAGNRGFSEKFFELLGGSEQ